MMNGMSLHPYIKGVPIGRQISINVKRTVKQPCGCAQSPLFSDHHTLGQFPVLSSSGACWMGTVPKTVDLESYQNEGAVRDILQEHLSWLRHCGLR